MRVLGALFLVLLSGCAPVVRTMMFVSPGPAARAPDHPIRFYREERPACPYEEIGLVSSRKPTIFVSMHEVEESIRERARRMGGDAVVGISERTELHPGSVSRARGGVQLRVDPVYSGTVVRFVHADCTS